MRFLTRRELADRLITPAAGPDQLRRALAFDPANLPARLALSRHATRRSTAELFRRWTGERVPSPLPEDPRRKIETLARRIGAADPDSR